jgi:two-component system, OmpR family, response regulator RpaB
MSFSQDDPIKILIADHDPLIRSALRSRLKLKGHTVITADSGAETLRLVQITEPDLLILDVLLPHMDGLRILARIRGRSDVPVILLSALQDVADRITGLHLGADDYLCKPFSARELDARIRAVMRRTARQSSRSPSQTALAPAGVYDCGDLQFDFTRRQAFRGQERLRLTELEFHLLELLIARAGQPISRHELLRRVWGIDPNGVSVRRLVDSHISRLRAKVEVRPDDPELILTCRGTGYMFRRMTAPSGTDVEIKPEAVCDLAAWRARAWGLPHEQP